MADIGGSTTGHVQTRDKAVENVATKRLENWGRWQRSLPNDGIRQFPDQPMFRDIVERYRESHASETFDADQAESTEALMVEILSPREIWTCRVAFILEYSARRGADFMSRGGFKCSHPTYMRWVTAVVEKIGDEIDFRP